MDSPGQPQSQAPTANARTNGSLDAKSNGSKPSTERRGRKRNGVVAKKILDKLADEPGQSAADIQRMLSCSHPNAARHLRLLARDGLVEAEKDSRETWHFLVEHTALHIRMLPYFRNEKKHRVLRIIASRPGREWNFNELSILTGTHHAFIRSLVKNLENRGMVEHRKVNVRYYVKANPRLVNVLREHDQSEYADQVQTVEKDPPSSPHLIEAV